MEVVSSTQWKRRVAVLEKEGKYSNNNQREAHADTKGPESAHKHACMNRNTKEGLRETGWVCFIDFI